MKTLKKNIAFKNDLDNDIEELVEDIVERAERERQRDEITDDSCLFCLMDNLRIFNSYVEKAYKCKSRSKLLELRKRFNNLARF